MTTPRYRLTRRRFMVLSGAAGAALLSNPLRLAASTAPELVAEEPWGGIVRLSDGVWAVASTPMKSSDWTTGCNGGLVAGSERLLAIESFLQPAGASWVASQAATLAGRAPTDVLITHFHGDHVNGLTGYAGEGEMPRLWMTETTRDLVLDTDREQGNEDGVRQKMLESAEVLSTDKPTKLDLGGRQVTLYPRSGHTPSDVTVEIEEPSIVFGGDLLWNGFFPNYRDTIPTEFSASVRAARRDSATVYVPGHGALADNDAVGKLLELIDAVERAGRESFERGMTPADAASDFQLPASVADWILFNEGYFERAISRWHLELGS